MQYQKPILVQEQKLKMNPQLYQSIQLMTLPLAELKFRIQEEVEKNPALEIIEDRSEVSLDDVQKTRSDDEEYYDEIRETSYIKSGGEEASDARQKFIEGVLSRPESLQDHLIWQLKLQPLSAEEYEIGELLIRNLDENGFHRENPQSFIPEDRLDLLPRIMDIIRGFEPVGTCTADYRESLLVQAQKNPDTPPGTLEILEHHFDLLEKGKAEDLAKAMKLEPKRAEEILAFIKSLNPFPGRAYSTEEPRYVIPDLMVQLKEGEFVIILNDEEIPVLGVNPFFTDLLSNDGKKTEKDVKQFVHANVRDAQWFIRSINQRNQTLLKIAKAIVEFQRDFFLKGPKYLVPLTLKDIANEVDVHETTVSRIANSKYIQTEWGIYELKYFFTNSISGAGSSGSRFSKQGVKEILKEIIEENPDLSDQKIAELLSKRGISIARRTVAKYRNELDIGSSYKR
ncbi:MAG TPA: RNA polymerase factor sigma-54 [Spirochaetia bacterium]|nr:RNA polymerase factor sigma-54 [Spirochaetia bacterium]